MVNIFWFSFAFLDCCKKVVNMKKMGIVIVLALLMSVFVASAQTASDVPSMYDQYNVQIEKKQNETKALENQISEPVSQENINNLLLKYEELSSLLSEYKSFLKLNKLQLEEFNVDVALELQNTDISLKEINSKKLTLSSEQSTGSNDIEYTFLESALGNEFEYLNPQEIKDLLHQKKQEILNRMDEKSAQKQEGRLSEVGNIITGDILSIIGYLFIIAVIIALPIAVPIFLLTKTKILNDKLPRLSQYLNRKSLLILYYVPIGLILILFIYGFALLFLAQQWTLKIFGGIANPSSELLNGVLTYLIDKSDVIIGQNAPVLFSFIERLSENQGDLGPEIQKLIEAGMPAADVLPYAIGLYNNLQGIGDVIEGLLILSILVLFFKKATPTLKDILKFPIEKVKNPELKLSDFVRKISNFLKLELKFLVVLPFIMLLITIPAVIIMGELFGNTIPILQQGLTIGFISIFEMFLLITVLTLGVLAYLSLMVRDKFEKKIALSSYGSTIKTTGIFVGVLAGSLIIFAYLSGYIHPIIPLLALNILLYKVNFINNIKSMFKFRGIDVHTENVEG